MSNNKNTAFPVLTEWSSFEEKAKAFGPVSEGRNLLNTPREFDEWMERKLRGYFRGMNEAKYKIYSSAYREWVNDKYLLYSANG